MMSGAVSTRRFVVTCAAACVLVALPHHGWPAQRQLTTSVLSIEFEDQVSAARASAGQVARQDMRGFGAGWSGAQIVWRAQTPVAGPIRDWPNLRIPFTVPVGGTYEVVLHHTVAPDFATYRVFLDGQPVADIDGYARSVLPRARTLGQRTLAAGRHELVVTLTGKTAASSGYTVGLDRLELRPDGTRTTDVKPTVRNTPHVPSGRPSVPPPRPAPGTSHAVMPGHLTAAVCLASPEKCCPKGGSTEGCRIVTEQLLAIRIRSYVPPRFTILGKHYPVDVDYHLANIVSDVTVTGAHPVWPGCRFNVTEAKNTIDDSKTILEKAGALLEAWLSQWSGGVEAAKGFVSGGVADVVCDVVNDSKACRDTVSSVVKTAINVGLASLGIPPEIPDVQQLREHGIRYLAATAVSYAMDDASILQKLPLDPQARALLYQQAYDTAVDILSKELNKVVPPANFTSSNPATWGHLEPAYAPHHAHLYIEVRVKPGQYQKYLQLLAASPTHKWAPLYLHDLNKVYASKGPIAVPTFIPPDGVILPIELHPFEVAHTKADEAPTQIPGVKISRAWLKEKFGISSDSRLVRAQRNYWPRIDSSAFFSDWDLFYDTNRQANFRLLMPIEKVLDWENDWKANTGSPRDADVGGGVVVKGQLKNYYGRIDPAPRCDGKPTVVAAQ